MKTFFAMMAVLCFSTMVFAELTEADKELAKETEVHCASTASTKATPELIKKKVAEAAELLEKEGSKAYSKFQGKGSEFLFAGTYIWIHSMEGKMLMHPIKPGLNGKSLMGLKDGNGKRFFVEMIDKCQKKGEGWVDYTWPKPGEKKRSYKISYVKRTTIDGMGAVVGCGTYEISEKEAEKLLVE